MLSAEILRQLLDYDPMTGAFTWLPRNEVNHFFVAWNKRRAGKSAGRTKPNKNGYLELAIDSKLYYCHRLAWLYMTGEWPKEQIDHIDGNKSDNRFGNLREASTPENAWNMHNRKSNRHGFAGVGFHRACRSRPYSSQIQISGKKIPLGYFETAELAHEAYVQAIKAHHGNFARLA